MAEEGIFADAAAPLLEATDTEALLTLWPLCQEMAMVRPGMATVRTLTADSTWSNSMEEMFQVSDASFATKLRWRRSYQGGRTIAQPAATARQLAVSRRLAGQQKGDQRHVAEISLAGPAGFDPDEVVNAIMLLVASKGLNLQEVSSTAITQPGNWQRVSTGASHGPAGRMLLHLQHPDHVAFVRSMLHERAFQAGADLITTLVQTEEESFAGRGARNRAGPLVPQHSV